MILAEIFDFFLKLYDILTAGKSRQGTITSLVPVSSNQNELEMIEKDGFVAIEKVAKLQLLKKNWNYFRFLNDKKNSNFMKFSSR